MIWCKTHDFLKILAELILNQSIDVHWICPGWSAGQQQQPKLPGSQPSHFLRIFQYFSHLFTPRSPSYQSISMYKSYYPQQKTHISILSLLPYTSIYLPDDPWISMAPDPRSRWRRFRSSMASAISPRRPWWCRRPVHQVGPWNWSQDVPG